jgi:hypothetical protein
MNADAADSARIFLYDLSAKIRRNQRLIEFLKQFNLFLSHYLEACTKL